MRAVNRFRLGFVPEQVNIPLLLCFEHGLFAKQGLDVSYQLIPEGTGRMIELIESEEIDLAFTVTDACMVAKAQDRKINLIGTYVESPLIWAALASPTAKFSNFSEMLTTVNGIGSTENVRLPVCAGISRLGSGSHTMAHYASMLHHLGSLNFHVSNNFTGLREGASRGALDFFLWEKFTTKPWVDRGELKLIGEVPTPWTAFSIISKDKFSYTSQGEKELDESREELVKTKLFTAISEGIELFTSEKEQESTIHRIVTEFKHTEEDAHLWLQSVRYAKGLKCDMESVLNSVRILKQVGLIGDKFTAETLWNDNKIITFK